MTPCHQQPPYTNPNRSSVTSMHFHTPLTTTIHYHKPSGTSIHLQRASANSTHLQAPSVVIFKLLSKNSSFNELYVVYDTHELFNLCCPLIITHSWPLERNKSMIFFLFLVALSTSTVVVSVHILCNHFKGWWWGQGDDYFDSGGGGRIGQKLIT